MFFRYASHSQILAYDLDAHLFTNSIEHLDLGRGVAMRYHRVGPIQKRVTSRPSPRITSRNGFTRVQL
jgi:hypothetical protein